MMHKTEWKEYLRGNKHRIRATYGIDEEFARRHNQAPYFSITGETEVIRGGKWREDSGGAIHDLIAKHFPQLAPYIKWHLFSVGKGPLHYIANAKYWWEKMAGISKWDKSAGEPDATEAFAHTVVLGALPGDGIPPTDKDAWPEVQTWLEARLPLLLEAFNADMEELERTLPYVPR